MTTIRIGSIAPGFPRRSRPRGTSLSTSGSEKLGGLFSHPKDFTPVCTDGARTAAKLKPEFDKRNVKILAVSRRTT